jgi:hypothetical protein
MKNVILKPPLGLLKRLGFSADAIPSSLTGNAGPDNVPPRALINQPLQRLIPCRRLAPGCIVLPLIGAYGPVPEGREH